MKKVYVDNSSTSFPKAPGVSDEIKQFLDTMGCNVGRGGYAASYQVALDIVDARQRLAGLFHARSPREIVFTQNVTHSLNLLLQGFLRAGDHVITTSMEHNAVMRPLHALRHKGVTHDAIPCDQQGRLNPLDILPLIRKETKAVVMLHASNVCGTILPVEAIAEICQERSIRLIVDGAQTAGALDVDASMVDAFAFTGHKSLLGPQGIGGFVIQKEFAEEVAPLTTGGTGSLSHEMEQPRLLPDKFESGTLNIPGILGLKKAVEYLQVTGVRPIHDQAMRLTAAFLDKARRMDQVRVIGGNGADQVAVVSLDFVGRDNAAIAAALDSNYGIMTRCGLHCAPAAHRTLGTYPRGTVRFSFGHFNTIDEMDYVARAIAEIMKSGKSYGFSAN